MRKAVVGDVVSYHGSKENAHGTYVVVVVPPDPASRGYVLRHEQDDDVIRSVHPDSFTILTIDKEEGRPAMRDPKKSADVEMNELDSYNLPSDDDVDESEFDPAGWADTMPLMMWAIRKGLLDPHLHALGEVMRERYKLLFPNLNAGTNPPPVSSSTEWFSTEEADALTLLGRDLVVPSTTMTGTGTVEYDGRRYLKKDMVDAYFRLPSGLLGDKGVAKHVGGKVVQIISVGRSRLRVRLAEAVPWATRPDFVQRLKTGQWDVDFSDVELIFEG